MTGSSIKHDETPSFVVDSNVPGIGMDMNVSVIIYICGVPPIWPRVQVGSSSSNNASIALIH